MQCSDWLTRYSARPIPRGWRIEIKKKKKTQKKLMDHEWERWFSKKFGVLSQKRRE
jgi:hypothetical protein